MTTGLFALGQQGGQAPQAQPANSNPFQLQQSDYQKQLQQQAQGLLALGQQHTSQPYNYDSAPKMMDANQIAAERQRLEQGLYGKTEVDLNRRYQQEEEAFRANLANQGLDIGSQRYQRELDAFRRSKDEAYNDAKFQSMMYGGQETDRMFEQSMKARQQAIGEMDALRDRPLKEMAALLDPLSKFTDIASKESIAQLGADLDKYGVDKTYEASKYDTDKAFETAEADRFSSETIAREKMELDQSIATQRNELEKALQEGRITSEEKIAAERNLIEQQIAAERTAAERQLQLDEQTFLKEEKKKDKKFQGGQNAKDRQIQREQIRASLAKMSNGGGEAALDPAMLAQLMELLG